MPRYTSTNTKKKYGKDKKLKHSFDTIYYLPVPEKDSDMYFITQEGDRLDNLAFRFYGDTNLWWFIARTNNLKSNNIPAGTRLRIPVKTDSANGF